MSHGIRVVEFRTAGIQLIRCETMLLSGLITLCNCQAKRPSTTTHQLLSFGGP